MEYKEELPGHIIRMKEELARVEKLVLDGSAFHRRESEKSSFLDQEQLGLLGKQMDHYTEVANILKARIDYDTEKHRGE